MARIRGVVSIWVVFSLIQAWPVHASPEATPSPLNLRPLVGIGLSYVEDDMGATRSGFGLGIGVEIERSPALSALLRFEYHQLPPPTPWVSFPALGPAPAAGSGQALTWQVGLRAYAQPESWIRPYAELCFGLRLDSEQRAGANVTPRVGISWARSRAAGLFAEVGYDRVIEHRDLKPIIPLRLGILYP